MAQGDTPGEVRSSEGLGLEPERAAFESWLNPGAHPHNVSAWVEPGRYEEQAHQMAWVAWKAAVAAERERCADDLARAVQGESILLAQGWAWSEARSEWVKV